MDLDNFAAFEGLDASQMISYIQGLPDQLVEAWKLGETAIVPKLTGIDHVLICSTGSSAIAATMVKQYLEPICPIPITVWQDCDIPAWAKNNRSLVLVSGFTGEENELLASFAVGLTNDCQLVAVATGGRLIDEAKASKTPYLVFGFSGPSRAALGFEFVLPLVILYKAGLINSTEKEIVTASAIMKDLQPSLDIATPVVRNPAKRMAGQFLNRLVTIFASRSMNPVAARWKSQLHENAKAWAQVELITETRHSTAAGILNPDGLLTHMMAIFLQTPFDEAYDQAGLDAARRLFMVEGFNTDFYRADGKSFLENMWSAVQYGDFISYYLAIAYEMDPTPVPGVEEISSMLT